DSVRDRFSADRSFACARCEGGAVLCLGERPAELATGLEFQQGADRTRRPRRGNIRIVRRAGWSEVVDCHRNGVAPCDLMVRGTDLCTYKEIRGSPACAGDDTRERRCVIHFVTCLRNGRDGPYELCPE